MVEMLGVLAVIGVLSIAAFMGYNMAMEKLWSNEILDEANKRAVSAMTQIDNGEEVSLGDFKDNVFRGGEFDAEVQLWKGEFGIRISKIPETVCQDLVTIGRISVVKVSAPETALTEEEECAEENDLYIVYQVAKASATDGEDEDTLANGCSNAYPILGKNGECLACPDIKKVVYDPSFDAASEDECKKCGTIYVYNTNTKRCVLGECPKGFYSRDGKVSNCRSCLSLEDLHSVSDAVLQACVAACPNRVIATDRG